MDKTLYRNTMNENRKNDRESDNKVEREICVGR